MKSMQEAQELRREYYELTNDLPRRPVQFSDIAMFASMAESKLEAARLAAEACYMAGYHDGMRDFLGGRA